MYNVTIYIYYMSPCTIVVPYSACMQLSEKSIESFMMRAAKERHTMYESKEVKS